MATRINRVRKFFHHQYWRYAVLVEGLVWWWILAFNRWASSRRSVSSGAAWKNGARKNMPSEMRRRKASLRPTYWTPRIDQYTRDCQRLTTSLKWNTCLPLLSTPESLDCAKQSCVKGTSSGVKTTRLSSTIISHNSPIIESVIICT